MSVRHADRSRIDDAATIEQAIERHMAVADHERLAVDAREGCPDVCDWGVHKHHFVVAARRRVAEADPSQTGNLDRTGQRQGAKPIDVHRHEPRRGPADERVGAGIRMPKSTAPSLDEPPIAIAAQPDRPLAERLQTVQGLGRERTIGEIAVEHDQLGLRGFDVGQNRFECG